MRKGKKKLFRKDGVLTVTFISLLCAGLIFIVLTVIENRIVNDRVTRPVVVVMSELPKGIVIDESNASKYFKVQQRAVDELPTCTLYNNVSQLYGGITSRTLYKNEMVTDSCFVTDDFYEDIEEPVEISIHVKEIGKVVGGTVRPGDLVDITAIFRGNSSTILGNSDTDDVILSGYGIRGDFILQTLAKGVRVKNVYNSSGESSSMVDVKGGLMIGTVINVVVPREMQGVIYTAMEEGIIYISKVVDDVEVIEE